MERNERLPSWKGHLSEKQLAQLRIDECADVGKIYETWGDVWNADPNDVQIGLLELILQELKRKTATEREEKRHRLFLLKYREKILKLIRGIEKEISRIEKLFGRIASEDAYVSPIQMYVVIARMGRFQDLNRECDRLNVQLKKLKGIKKVDDLIGLTGIGANKLNKIKQRILKDEKDANATKDVATDQTQSPAERNA